MATTTVGPSVRTGACTALAYRQGGLVDDFPLSEIDSLLREDGTLVWLDVERPTEDHFDILSSEFGLHQLAIDDIRKSHQRPKLDEYGDSRLIVLFDAQLTPQHHRVVLRELDIFVGPKYFVTVHRFPVPAVATLRNRLYRNPKLIERNPPGFLLYYLADELVDNYFPIAEELESKIGAIEDRLFGKFDPSVLRDISTLRRDLIRLRKVLSPERDVFNLLSRQDNGLFEQATLPYFRDVFDLLLRVTETVDTMRELLSIDLESYLSLQSNSLNETVRRLTALTVMLFAPTLISGIYGMNFEKMPELQWQYGYPLALALMALSALATLIVMRRKNWL